MVRRIFAQIMRQACNSNLQFMLLFNKNATHKCI
ncbi:hypothetical protein Patl1_22372 [Pistacia atlantica]|uniref:Uncharacterized protein n=1 Tax=Pistacia atlantica TaxID=434234 RepID=A0ACC0ZXP2_9ROSI|nr:hypothetical protein Patl1_22372 [Pistacia atlantica]